jgi:hypothetical protein
MHVRHTVHVGASPIGYASSAGSIREVASWSQANGAEINEQFWLLSVFIKEKKNLGNLLSLFK